MRIKEEEERDAVRLVWNAMANSKTTMAKVAIPQALHYTPLANLPQPLLKDPLRCFRCQAYMNPYSPIHIDKLHYTCCICKSTNALPLNYLQGQEQMPPETTLNFSSFLLGRGEPTLAKQVGLLFVIDLTLETKELEAVKKSMLEVLNNLEEGRTVGLITYHKYVCLHDLTSKVDSTITFSPNHSFDPLLFSDLLAIPESPGQVNQRYLLPLLSCKQVLIPTIRALQKIVPKSYKHQRNARSTGQALNVALSLSNLSQISVRVVLLCGGVCTTGLGKVISQDYRVEIRSIGQQLPSQSKEAIQFYTDLGERAKGRGIAIDSFIFSVEEAGLTEMLPCLTSTGGLLVQHEEFDSDIFRESFRKAYFEGESQEKITLGTAVGVEIRTSPEIMLTSFQGDKKVGNNYWRVGNMTENSTLTFQLEHKDNNTEAEAFYIQLKTTFKDSDNLGVIFQRVTTIRRLFVETAQDMMDNFDPEAALLMLAKLSIQRTRNSKSQDLRLWADNILIKWAKVFAKYRPGDPESFKLPEKGRVFPQYVYYLRRSPLIRRSGISLDEYSYISELVKKQTTMNALLMIQPALLSYNTQEPAALPVTLDEKHMRASTVLVLDSFLNIVEWQAKDVESWFSDHEQAGQFSQMHEKVLRDVNELKKGKFPIPCVYVTGVGRSRQRFIKSRLGSREDDQEEGNNISDQADIGFFTSKLSEMVVGNN